MMTEEDNQTKNANNAEPENLKIFVINRSRGVVICQWTMKHKVKGFELLS